MSTYISIVVWKHIIAAACGTPTATSEGLASIHAENIKSRVG